MPRKTNVAAAIDRALGNASRTLVRTAIAELPRSTTVGELLDAMPREHAATLRGMTLSEFVATASGDGAAPPARRGPGRPRKTASAKKTRRKAAKKSTTNAKARTTRTQAGREKMDADVAAFLQGKGGVVAAEEIRESVGGSPQQLRDSLLRWTEAKKVKRTGERRGTRYSWKG